jgi:iron complex outermembrane receptor protein
MRVVNRLFLLLGAFLLSQYHPAFCQEDTLLSDSLHEIVVRALRIGTTATKAPFSVTVLDESRIRTGQNLLSLAESLPAVPGIVVQNDANYAQDLRISIRGFGARAGFGIRGIRILSDGFPESSPDGQGQVDQIDPTNLRTIEVVRGPSAGLYGNAAGGVLQLFTQKPDQTGIAIRAVGGSFGFRQYRIQGALKGAHSSLYGAISRVQVNGFRALSAMRATAAFLKYEGTVKRDSTLSWLLLANYTDSPIADDPGGLTAAQVASNPKMAHPLNVQFRAGESIKHARIGAGARKEINPHQVLSARIWSIWRDFENRLPFRAGGQAAFERLAAGGALTWEGNAAILKKLHWTIGAENEYQLDQRTRYDNLDGVRGNLNLRQDELFRSLGIFGQLRFPIHQKADFSAGLRSDWIGAEVKDQFLSDGDQSGKRQFQRWSPWAGISTRLSEAVNLFANFSTNFETPTLNELSNNPAGTGGFSETLLPQRTHAWEIGLKGREKMGLFFWEFALFHSRTTDEISPYELPGQPGRTYFQNAGITLRRGIEMAIDYRPSPSWRLWANYAISQFQFLEFQFSGIDLSGNNLPGLPSQQGQISARYTFKTGWVAQTGCRYTGKMFADQMNMAEVPAGTWISLRIAREWKKIAVFAAAENLADAQPYNNIRINAAGNRFFEPGQGRSFSFGLTIASK